MKIWKSKRLIVVATMVCLLLAAASVQAQDSDQRGSIRGGVYKDVNGDGRCVNTGVAGEEGVANVEIVFTSSDKATVVTLTTGSDGTYGLVAAGQSIWEVTARPDAAKWVVTSKNPLFVPVLPDPGLVQTDINFCVSQGTNGVITQGTNAVIVILPQSGAAATNWQLWVMVTAVTGVILFGTGALLEWRRRQSI